MTNNCAHDKVVQNKEKVQNLIVYNVDLWGDEDRMKNNLQNEYNDCDNLSARFIIRICVVLFVWCFYALI